MVTCQLFSIFPLPPTFRFCFLPSSAHYDMAPSATFCNIPLSTSVDPLSATSRVSLDWVLSAGIPTSRSIASGVLILPCGDTVSSMHTKLSVTSGLPYDLVLGRDWLFFCRETLPHSSFHLSSGTVSPGQPPAAPLGLYTLPGSHSTAMEVDAEQSINMSPQGKSLLSYRPLLFTHNFPSPGSYLCMRGASGLSLPIYVRFPTI